MNVLTKKAWQLFILFIVLLSASETIAQNLRQPFIDSIAVRKDSFATVRDELFYSSVLHPKLNKPYYEKNTITLKFNETAGFILPAQFSVRAILSVDYVKYRSITDSVTGNRKDTLFISYNKADTANYNSVQSVVFDSMQTVKVTVTSVTLTGTTSTSDLIKSMVIENQVEPEPNFIFSCTANAITSITVDNIADRIATTGELLVQWPVSIGADAYDLEWTFIDQDALNTGVYGNAGSPDAAFAKSIFLNNSTRVTTTDLSYKIPLIFPGTGTLYIRVRAVQNGLAGARYTSDWSSSALPSGLGSYYFAGHQTNINWQSSVSFAEEGKRKVVVQYYDGSLRSRQTVTKDNTVNRTVVAETLYDYQGRPVIQVLPAPTLSRLIAYSTGFNHTTNNKEYDKSTYDLLLNPAAYCGQSAPAMGSQGSGAAQYYSSASAGPNNVERFLPDAEGYVFTETEYTQDNTGRISRQSGVGSTFKLGGGHETKYFYGTPSQDELDALFGTEVGDHSHYFKNAVRDANGQFSISYVDMHGRTIATALAGGGDPLVPLSKLASYHTPETTTENVTEASDNVIKDLVMETHRSLLVTDEGEYTFNYDLDPQTLQKNNCEDSAICYNCLYDLEITISSSCNNELMPGDEMFIRTIKHGSLAMVNDSCGKTTIGIHTSDVLPLVPGSYEITKKLSVSKYAADFYRDSVFIPNNTCTTEEAFIEESRQMALESECEPTCLSCREALGEDFDDFYLTYIANAGIDIQHTDTVGLWKEVTVAYNEAIAACDALCGVVPSEYDDIRNMMLADVSASSGQYANNIDVIDNYSIFRTIGSTPRYKTHTYVDEFGNPDKVIDDNTGNMVAPDDLDEEQFFRKFKPSWAVALLSDHPEFCKLSLLNNFKSSLDWSSRMERIETYQQAVDSGFINPLSNDPMMTIYNNATVNPVKTALTNKVQTFVSATNPVSPFQTISLSMEEMAVKGVSCAQNDQACLNYFDTHKKHFSDLTCPGEQDMAWKLFRSLYLSTKRELIFSQINSSGCTSTTAANLFAAGKMPRFATGEDFTTNNQTGLEYWSGLDENSDRDAMKDAINSTMNTTYEDNCKSYATLWFNELKTCVEYDSADIVDEIIPALVEVCKNGSDANHPWGAREVRPGVAEATPPPAHYSFEDVITAYNSTHSIAKNEFCNADVISAPAGYDKQPPLTNQVVYTKPDSCTCSTITARHNEYLQYQPGSYSSFSNFMLEKYNATITNTELNNLLDMCDGTASCRYLTTPVSLPPALQCGNSSACKTCLEVDSYYDQFGLTYNFTPTREETDTLQQRRNRLFENFMNQRLGFSKQTWEYLDFLDTCTNAGALQDDKYGVQRECVSCDSLQKLVNQYFDTLTVSGGSQSEMLSFIANKLSTGAHAIQTDTTAIKAALLNCNLDYHKNVYHKSGTAFYAFNASNTNINIGDNGDDFSIEFLGNFASHQNRQPILYFMSKDNSGQLISTTTYKGYYVYEDVVGSAKYIFVVLGDNASASNYIRIRSQSAINANQWYHITITRVGNTASGVKIYIDGVEVSTVIVDGPGQLTTGDIAPSGRPLLLAHDSYTGGQGYESVKLKNLRLFARALMSPEILLNKNECNGIPTDTTQMRLWAKLDEGYGAPKDYSSFNSIGSWITIQHTSPPTELDKAKTWAGKKGYAFNDSCINNNNEVLCDYLVKDSLLLCGSTLYPTVDTTTITICSDSTFFAVSNGVKRYTNYKDSLTNDFDSLYRARCLQAYKYESFTVTHSVSEYHYTLYYYDQAGNLVKTVPPQDVVPNRNSTWLADIKTKRTNGQVQVPTRKMATDYRYNTLNQVVKQSTPDAGLSAFYYDRLGRLVLSKNSKQAKTNKYSYTKYDYLGRIKEVGELTSSATMNTGVSKVPASLSTWMDNADASSTDITLTNYDLAYPVVLTGYLEPKNLRNRVAWTALYTTAANRDNVTAHTTATFYSYDIHGNVDTLLQDYTVGAMQQSGSNRFKKIVYNYDLISGKVNMVSYQPDKIDAFYHRYVYDAENRLTDVYTSANKVHWEHDAYYEYYRHGPLARTILGQQQVQGVDYAYTLQGWLKGVNSTALSTTADMGDDGETNDQIARDAFGFALHYFGPDDYKPVSTAKKVFPTGYNATGAGYTALYNGNIAAISVNLHFGTHTTGKPLLYQYGYDQLNRLVSMQTEIGLDTTTNTWAPVKVDDYKENVSYDANGNILTYKRNGAAAVNGTGMDSLEYKYYYIKDDVNATKASYDPLGTLPTDAKTFTNQLAYITDDATSTYTEDIDGQSAGNYVYDEIGNLIKDNAEKIDEIQWTVYGKIKSITKKQNGAVISQIDYTYDASGNRISKIVDGKETWYVRDASGNVMGVYTKQTGVNSGHLTLEEVHLYGSSRLGIVKPNLDVTQAYTIPAKGSRYFVTFTRGKKFFELSNHLGNVLAAVSDKKISIAKASPNQNQVSYYLPHIVSANDYYPFGMIMPGRAFTGTDQYRYGFNGQEKSPEIDANHTTALYWEYDSRIGRRWNLDPEVKDNESPYATFSNNPVFFSDVLGNTPGDPKQKQKSPEPVNLTASQTSAAISSALFSIHTNTKYNRSYYIHSSTPETKKPYLGIDLYDETNAKFLGDAYGIKPSQVADFVNTYKNYYNNFATIGMWFDGSKTIEELYKAMDQVSPEKQYKLANDFINDFVAKNEKWQQLSDAGVSFGNILMMYGGQELNVGNGIKAPFKSATNPAVNNKVSLVDALAKVGGNKAVSQFLGWGNRTTILKSATDFTKDQLLKAGYTKQVLTDIAAGLREAAKKTLPSRGELNPASISRAEQVEQIIKTHF